MSSRIFNLLPMTTSDPLLLSVGSEEAKPEISAVEQSREGEGDANVIEYPEGGLQAWLVVFGSFLGLFSTWGVINSYVSIVLPPSRSTPWLVWTGCLSRLLFHRSPSQLIVFNDFTYWSFATVFSVWIFPGDRQDLRPIWAQRQLSLESNVRVLLTSAILQVLVPLGSVIIVISLMLLSLCQANHAYQFFLTHGLLFGIGITIAWLFSSPPLAIMFSKCQSALPFRYTPVVAVIGHWFYKKRPFAIGVIASGSSIGGVIYPIVLQRLIPKVGFPWAVRVMAFINMGCLAVSCLTIKTRLKPTVRRSWRQGLVDLSGFKESTFCLACAATFMWEGVQCGWLCTHVNRH